MAGAQILDQIVAADNEPGQPVACPGNLRRPQHAQRRFDHAPERVARPGGRRRNRVGMFNLGQQHAVQRQPPGQIEIGRAIGGADAQDQLTPAPVGGECGGDAGARRVLRFGRDRVFEVEDHAIDRQGPRLFERAGLVAGHIEHRPAGADMLLGHPRVCAGAGPAMQAGGCG